MLVNSLVDRLCTGNPAMMTLAGFRCKNPGAFVAILANWTKIEFNDAS